MQRLETSKRKVDKTLPTLPTSLEYRCKYLEDAMGELQAILRYAILQISPGHADADEARSRSRLPNDRSARKCTGG